MRFSSAVLCAIVTFTGASLRAQEVQYSRNGYTSYGEWMAEMRASPARWAAGDTVRVTTKLVVGAAHLANFAADNMVVDGFALLVTAERTFDSNGWIRLASDERMSTLLTPTGLPIEGGTQGAVTTRFGYFFRSPVDQLVRVPLASATRTEGRIEVTFQAEQKLPADLPPGIYRLRLDYGITIGTRNYSLQGKTFAARQSAVSGRAVESHLFSPPLPASGYDIEGRWVDGPAILPRLPYVLLNNYNSNGYRGVVADEDRHRFAISSRNLIQDDVVLPLYDAAGRVLSYSLEPQFLTDTVEVRNNIPWDFAKGAISVEVTAPDGKVTNLGTLRYVGNTGQWPTTRNSAVTAWRPTVYGPYTVKLQGWISDLWGNTYQGGGTYRFWIANRMTMATATFQGMPYPVGSRYGRDIGFAPAVPAEVEIRAKLYVNSDLNEVREATWSGRASPAGIYGAAQGAKNLLLDAPGEYAAHILARYVDQKGHLWVCSMRHAGVVYPEDSRITARGKKLYVGGKFLERGDTNAEGWYDTANAFGALAHINFPWRAGDVLLIASEGQTANKIEPVLTYEWKDKPQAYDSRFNTIGATNLQFKTSNSYSPHQFPEYITDRAYFYAAGPRPGFMGRFLVGEDGIFAPYWHLSPNSFGGQIGASNNGDLPGDIYRLIGGVVLRRAAEGPEYGGYVASAFVLPQHTGNNRVIAAGSEDLLGPTGQMARFFLVGPRPGMMYETGSAFAVAVQIDPILPANLKFMLRYPDGREVSSTTRPDAFGSAAGARWTLDQPGLYRYQIEAEWEGHRGIVPGLPADGGDIYVVEQGKPKDAPEITFNLPVESTFDPARGVHITGTSTAGTIYYAAVIPGSVIDQGSLTVTGGKFDYFFDPVQVNARVPTYDIQHRVTGRAEIGDVVHLTFLAKEKHPSGNTYHSFARIVIRGNKVVCTR